MTELSARPASPRWSSPSHPVPSPKQVKDFLTEVLDREVTLRPAEPFAPGPFLPASYGVYADASLRVVGVVVLDLPLSAYVGAAAGRLPSGTARACISSMRLERPVELGLHRVLVEVPRLLAGAGAVPRVYEIHPVGRSVPDHVSARAQVRGDRQDFTVTVPAYGTGRLSLVHS